MPVKGSPDHLYLGHFLSLPSANAEEPGNFAIKAAISEAAHARFDFVVLPLAAPGGQGARSNFNPSVDSALVLDARTWSSSVIGAVSTEVGSATSSALNVVAHEQSPIVVAQTKRECLETELRWASHLGLRAVLLPPAQHGAFCTYARDVNELLQAGIAEGDEEGMALAVRTTPCVAGWAAWNRMRSLCNYHRKLIVALEFDASASLSDTSDRELQRWRGESVRYAIVPAECFVRNKQGYPVLPKKHKALLLDLMDRQVQVVFASGSASTEEVNARISYVARLFQSRPAPSQADLFAQSHMDCLQAPLQPLADNLESQTYELFETDPVKYVKYEEAVYEFLMERVTAGRASAIVVMVLGAGRGPLVAAALRAASRAEVSIALWAVEKNPNAVHALRHRRRSEAAWRCVEIVAEDMRTWVAPRKADVIISELLGSFGDNELSPECLDAAQSVMAEDGVCIPQRYVSSLTPVSATPAWESARSRGELTDLEMGYVVRLHKAFYPSSSIKDCFVFEHPNLPVTSNERYIELQFEVEVDSLVHGFAGYFDCDLYGRARISIHPEHFSEGMFSWFPIFFPLLTPLSVRKGDVIRVHFWRRVLSQKVWYEWALSEPISTPLQNPGGRAYAIGL